MAPCAFSRPLARALAVDKNRSAMALYPAI